MYVWKPQRETLTLTKRNILYENIKYEPVFPLFTKTNVYSQYLSDKESKQSTCEATFKQIWVITLPYVTTLSIANSLQHWNVISIPRLKLLFTTVCCSPDPELSIWYISGIFVCRCQTLKQCCWLPFQWVYCCVFDDIQMLNSFNEHFVSCGSFLGSVFYLCCWQPTSASAHLPSKRVSRAWKLSVRAGWGLKPGPEAESCCRSRTSGKQQAPVTN